MKISIITVCKNSENYIERAIQSVQKQSYEDIEYIVIDGQSKDSTVEIIERYSNTIHDFVSESDSGIYSAMNKGIGRASGDFIYFLNSDDYLVDENVIQDIAQYITENPDSDIVYGNLEVREPSGQVHVFTPPPPEGIPEFMMYGSMPHQATFARRRLFETFGYFDESYSLVSDVAWYLNLLQYPELKWKRVSRAIGSYYNGGRTLDNLWITKHEYWDVQNKAQFYQTEEWSQKRIRKFQSIIINLEGQLSACRDELKQSVESKNKHSTKVADSNVADSNKVFEKQQKIKYLREQLKKCKAEIRAHQRHNLEIEQLKSHLKASNEELQAMQSSKFWKIRSKWIKLKRIMGIHKD
jgi:glycosyltransferase involved in cell wall biosynthesis